MHDFKKFPELTNAQLPLYQFSSPFPQIYADFRGKCVKVHDGDTIHVRWEKRDFEFPIRFLDIDAPELNQPGGKESRDWLSERIMNEEIEIQIDKNNRVEKWGRLLGRIFWRGLDVGMESMNAGHAKPFESRHEGKIPRVDEVIPKF